MTCPSDGSEENALSDGASSREAGSVPALHEQLYTFAQHAEITPTGLSFTGPISYEQWAAFGESLWRFEEASRWCLGDWYLHGEDAFEEHSQALPDDSYRLETLRQYAWVASRVGRNTRVTFCTLPWVHFREVASLERSEQEELLRAAQQNGWTRRELHDAVQAFKRELIRGSQPRNTRRADPQRLAHVVREYRLELDQIRSVMEPLVRMAHDSALENLHRAVKTAIKRLIDYCEPA